MNDHRSRQRHKPRAKKAEPTLLSPEGLSRRQERVGRRIREEVAERLREVDDRNLGLVTVTECVVSSDLRQAKVGVSVLGDEAQQSAGLLIVGRLLKRWRGDIGRALGTRVIPELHAQLDGRLEKLDRINQLIKEARAGDPHPEPLTEEEATALRAAAGSGLSPAVARLAEQAGQSGAAGRFLTDKDFDDEDDDEDFDEDDFDDDEDEEEDEEDEEDGEDEDDEEDESDDEDDGTDEDEEFDDEDEDDADGFADDDDDEDDESDDDGNDNDGDDDGRKADEGKSLRGGRGFGGPSFPRR